MTTLQKTLQSLMQEKGLSPTQLSKVTGVKQPVIHRILTGETLDPKVGTVAAIADFFKVSINQLIGESSKSEHSIPLIPIQSIFEYMNGSYICNSKYDILNNDGVSSSCIASVVSDSTMLPRFAKDTVIIVDTNLKPKDRSFIIIYLYEKNITLFRQLLLDGNEHYLKPLNPDFKMVHIKSKFEITGVVIGAHISLGKEDDFS